jgi:hypothetical protein
MNNTQDLAQRINYCVIGYSKNSHGVYEDEDVWFCTEQGASAIAEAYNYLQQERYAKVEVYDYRTSDLVAILYC